MRGSASKYSGSPAFCVNPTLQPGVRGIGTNSPGARRVLQQQKKRWARPWRHRQGGGREQCLMGVKGLTGYVNYHLRGAAPDEKLGEVCCVNDEGEPLLYAMFSRCLFSTDSSSMIIAVG